MYSGTYLYLDGFIQLGDGGLLDYRGFNVKEQDGVKYLYQCSANDNVRGSRWTCEALLTGEARCRYGGVFRFTEDGIPAHGAMSTEELVAYYRYNRYSDERLEQ